MRQRPHIFWTISGMLLGLALAALLPHFAHAAADGSVGSFSCSGGVASGKLYDSGPSCPTTLTMTNLFSFLICNMEQLSSNLMGHMYCGMVQSLAPLVWAMATLAVVIFGVSFTVGIVPATGQDAILFLLKLTLVTAFATKADLLIGTGYRFLIGGIKDGVTIVIGGLGGTITDSNGVYTLLDNFLATAMRFATDNLNAKGSDDYCKNAVYAVFATMMVAFPVFGYLGLVLAARIAITFFRAVFGYVYAIVGITFLLTLAPFFVSFYLFKQTSPFFDKWLGYLVSFALQAVLLFAFLAFILMIDVKSITSNLPNIIMYKDQQIEGTAMRFPWQYCTLCDFDVVDKDTNKPLDANAPDMIRRGKLQCKDPKTAIDATAMMAPRTDGKPGGTTPQLNALLEFAGNGLLALIVLAIIVERLLAQVPYLAQKIAGGMGAGSSPQIGGGRTYGNNPSMSLPGESLMDDFNKGFDSGYRNNANSNSVSKSIQGLKDGMAMMISGKTTRNEGDVDAQGKPLQGLGYQWRQFIKDPNRMDRQ